MTSLDLPAGATSPPDGGRLRPTRLSVKTPDSERELSAPPTPENGAVPAPPSSPISESNLPACAESQLPFSALAEARPPFLLPPFSSLVRLEANFIEFNHLTSQRRSACLPERTPPIGVSSSFVTPTLC
ncbi:hypothetical protein TURU_129908 [Turdus rufiventris]|nr:hypothetical protein TURU_129908 [Turdus rufiventris]